MTAVVENSVGVGSRTVSEALGAGVQPGAVMCVEISGRTEAGWLLVDSIGVHGTEDRQCAVVGVGNGAVLAAGPVSQVRVTGEPVPTADSMPAWASTVASGAWIAADLRVERDQLRDQRDQARVALQRQETRLDEIVCAAHEYADSNSLCSEFDRFMISQNLPPRSRDWVCEVDVTVRVRIPSSAHSSDAAASTITEEMASAAVGQLRPDLLADAVRDFDVVYVEED